VNLKDGDWRGLSYLVKKIEICTLDLTKSEAELFANMEGNNCRRAIRGAIKKGVVIEETNDLSFVDEYFAQHQAVMARKSLKPLYSLNFIRQMITHFLPTGNLLLLRAKNPDGVCIATHIDLVFNKVAVYWGGAGWPDYFRLHSSELIYWHSMMKVKSMGAEVLNLGPLVKKFKTKFGASTMPIFRLMKAKDPILNILVYFVLSIYIRVRNWIRKD
jgi:lipid II:glycine glycyltransferase (peptidoglycan interpeptide bridge formation enzyme)